MHSVFIFEVEVVCDGGTGAQNFLVAPGDGRTA
jgi:hypothetical protein